MSGSIEDYSEETLLEMLVLNVFSLTALCKYFAPQMKVNKSGYILNSGSLAGYQPIPYIAAYAASKIYVLNFSEAIAMELENKGISMPCYSPRHTDTEFFDRADISKDSRDSKFYAQKTRVSLKSMAQDAVEKMFEGKLFSIHGLENNALTILNRLSPSRKFTARISKKLISK